MRSVVNSETSDAAKFAKSLTERQIAEQAARGDSTGGRSTDFIQQQVRRVLLQAYRHTDVVDAEEAATGERQIHVAVTGYESPVSSLILLVLTLIV